MLNGDRLTSIRGCKLRGSASQGELPLDEQPALPASQVVGAEC
jgi:hypothetical protein